MHLCKVPNLIRHKNSLKDCILLLYNTVALLQQACVVKCNNCIHAAGARGDAEGQLLQTIFARQSKDIFILIKFLKIFSIAPSK